MSAKEATVITFAWIAGSLVCAGILAVFQEPGDRSYWSNVALYSALILAIAIALWVRGNNPRRDRGLWVLSLVLIIPAIILGLAFGPGPALSALAGGLVGVLLITWPYLTSKKPAPTLGD